MSFAIQLDQNQSLINAKLMGEVTPDTAIEFFHELLHRVEITQVDRIFTDVTEMVLAKPKASFLELPDVLLRMGFPTNLKRAILVAQESDSYKLWENILFRKGFQHVKLFWEEDKAREWLMSS